MRHLLILLSAWCLTACENILVNEEVPDDQVSMFNLLWEDFDKNYAGFAVRNVDWDSVRSPALVRINTGLSDQEFFELLGGIILNFEDIHTEIIDVQGQRIRYLSENPNSISHIGPLENYLEAVRQADQLFVFGNIMNENVGYIHVPTFNSRFDLQKFERIDAVIRDLGDVQGLILDLRNNNGGEASSQKAVARRFIDQSFTYIKAQFRNGPEHNDFDEPITDDISPGGVQFTRPIVVLTNRSSKSSAELLVMTLESQAHVTVVGDTTAGGLGLNAWRELPNGWNYRMTLTLTSNGEGISYEAAGIPPDEVVFFTMQDSINGIDPQIERAIEILQ